MKLIAAGLTLLWNPNRGWGLLRSAHSDAVALVGYVLILGLVPFAFRMAGHFLGDFGVVAGIAEALLFVFVVLGAASAAGVLAWATSRRMGHEISELHAQELVLFSATPFFALGPLYAIPAPSLQPYILLISLGWGAFLLFRGLWLLSTLDPRGVTVVALTTAATWILGSAVLSQVMLLLLSPR